MGRIILAALAALMATSAANATVYIVGLTINTVVVTGSITTDGTIGTINKDDILSYTFSFATPASRSTPSQNITISGTSDYITQSNMTLTATATDITYDFETLKKNSPLTGFDFDDVNGVASFCIQGTGCIDGSPGLSLFYDDGPTIASNKLTGVQSIAHVQAAVPETASWAMFITGFGMMGAALRRRRYRLAAA